MDWQVFHDYNRLATEGKVTPWRCPDDGNELSLQADRNFDPVLHCYWCLATTRPGQDMYDRMVRDVENQK